MPSRLVREGILTSERVDQLDPNAEVFYRRLMSKVDDHGLYDARMSILRTSLYPLRVDRVREADISRWIAACVKAGLIALYSHDGKPYLQMLDTRWTTRSEPKYPLPPADITREALPSSENSCAQSKASAPVVVDGDGGGDEDGGGKRKRRAPAALGCPPDVPEQVWSDWTTLRKAKRAPATETVLQAARGEAEKAGLTLAEFLQVWCLRGSQGLQADWLKPDEVRAVRGSASAEPAWRTEQRSRVMQAVPGIAARDSRTVEAEICDVTPRRLG